MKVNSKDTVWSGLKVRLNILTFMGDLEDLMVDDKKLEELSERSIKETAKLKSEQEIKSFSKTMIKSNEKLIDRLLILINSTIIKFKKEIKKWPSKRKNI